MFDQSLEASLHEPPQRRSESFQICDELSVIRRHNVCYRKWRHISHTKMTSSLLPWVFLNSTSEIEVNNTANVVTNLKLGRFCVAVFVVEKQKLFLILTVRL